MTHPVDTINDATLVIGGRFGLLKRVVCGAHDSLKYAQNFIDSRAIEIYLSHIIQAMQEMHRVLPPGFTLSLVLTSHCLTHQHPSDHCQAVQLVEHRDTVALDDAGGFGNHQEAAIGRQKQRLPVRS